MSNRRLRSPQKGSENQGLLLGLIGVLSFALTLPATRFLVDYMGPLAIGLGRALVAAVVALILLIATRQPWPNRMQLGLLGVVAVCVVIGFPLLSAFAMQSLPASHGGVVLGILPLATAAAGTLFSTERPSLGFWLVGLLGAALVVSYSVVASNGLDQQWFDLHSLQLADGALVLAVVSAAIGYAAGAKLAADIGGWQVICWALVLALPFIAVPSAYSLAQSVDWPNLPPLALWCFLYLALVSQLTGFFFWYKGLALGGVARVSQLQLLQPFMTIVISAWLLSEAVSMLTWTFAVAVIATVILSKNMLVKHNKSSN